MGTRKPREGARGRALLQGTAGVGLCFSTGSAYRAQHPILGERRSDSHRAELLPKTGFLASFRIPLGRNRGLIRHVIALNNEAHVIQTAIIILAAIAGVAVVFAIVVSD